MYTTENIVDRLIEIYNLDSINLQNYSFTVRDLLISLIELESVRLSSISLDIEEGSLESIIRRKLKPLFPHKKAKEKWYHYLLFVLSLKRCKNCLAIKPFSHFYKDNSRAYKITSYCSICNRQKSEKYRAANKDKVVTYRRYEYLKNRAYYLHKNALRKATLLKATPAWADLVKIKEIYKKCPAGYHVDHIIPLQNDLVCGLHIETNLRVIHARDNLVKSNKFTVD